MEYAQQCDGDFGSQYTEKCYYPIAGDMICAFKDCCNKETQMISIAAQRGDAQVQYDMGKLFGEGKGVAVNYAEAFKWYSLSASQGCAAGQNGLGWCYN